MKTTDLKKQVIEDLQLIIDMAICEAEKTGDSFYEYKKRKQPKTAAQLEDVTYDFIYYNNEKKVLNDIFTLKYDQYQIIFPVSESIFLSRKVKNGFGNGKSEQPTKNKRSELDANGKMFQAYIADLRHDYHFSDYLATEQNERRKKAVVVAYKKAQPNDLIRLCWKYIIQPEIIEGINIPYSEEPKVIFTPNMTLEKTDSKNILSIAS
jgi:hypothetical protein